MYKNNLQEFTKGPDFTIYLYQTVNDGQPHDPKFRDTVWVAGISYMSQSTFSQKKATEQEASGLALEISLGKTKDEGHLMYKNHLQKFTTRSDFAIHVYQYVNKEQPHDPRFRSTV